MIPYYSISLSTLVLGLCWIPISGTTKIPRHPHACVQHMIIVIKLDNRFAYDYHVDLSSFSTNKSCLQSLLTTVAVDRTPNWNHCWKLVGRDDGNEDALYQIWGPGNKNPLIEKRFAICLISAQKSFLHSLFTTVALDCIPDWNHCWKLVCHW